MKTTKNIKLVDSILNKCFVAGDGPYHKPNTVWWILYDEKIPIGTAGLTIENNEGFLCRVAILPEYRGKGLQKKLIKTRVRKAKKLGLTRVFTYTFLNNPQSCNSLIKTGFKMYRPAYQWAGTDALYWYKLI